MYEKDFVFALAGLIFFSFCGNVLAQADEISELKVQMKAMEDRHQKEMLELKARIEAPEVIEERITKVEEKADRAKPDWMDRIKITGSLYEYYLWEDNAYFDQNRSDRFLESTARLGVEAQLLNNLVLNLGILGEAVTGDYDEYTQAADDDWNMEMELANFVASDIFNLPLTLTIGRQNIGFGDGFLIYDFYSDQRAVWTGSMRSLYAVKVTYAPKDNLTIDAFAGEADRDYTSYETYMKDFVTYTGRRNIFGVNTHYEGKSSDIWDFGIFYKNDESSLDSDTLALSLRASIDNFLIPDLKIESEFVPEFGTTKVLNGALSTSETTRRAFGGHLDFIYNFKHVKFSPFIRVAYNYFPGDDPDSSGTVESFDPMFYGFKDWGKWYVGSINSYNVFNTNERAAVFEAGLSPSATTSLRIQYTDINLDRENNANAGKRFSREWNLIYDWFPNDYFFCGVELGFAQPLKAARVYAGDDEDTLEVVTWAGVQF